MEVVQTVGPLACAPSHGAPPATHSRLRIDGDRSLHVQTEEGGGGLDPSWWKISASGSWDGGERRMRYGKLIDDGPGGIPGAVQRRKLEMLETHAPGASMRVVHSQSTSSWVQDPSNSNSSELNSGISNSRRSILSSSSSSTRVTSFRQWSSNFSQNSNSTLGIKSDTRPASGDFGNLELVLNPLDVSSLRTRGNVGRSGSIGARRPPSRGRRFSASLTGDESPTADEGGSHDSGKEKEVKKEDSASPNAGKSWTAVVVSLNSGEPSLRQRRIPAKTAIHRKRSVSSEDVRDGEQNSGNNDEGQWMRGAAVRRSLPSSEWRSVLVGTSDNKGPRRISPVPSAKYGSFVTAESLREMKGKLKHHGSTEIREDTRDLSTSDVNQETAACLGGSDLKTSSVEEDGSDSKGHQEDRRRSWSVGCGSQGQEDEGSASRRRSYAFEFSAEERGESPETRGRSQEKRGDLQRGKLRVESQPYHLEAVNQVLKRWSALSNDDEDSKTQNTSSTVIRSAFEDIRQDSPVKNSSIWLDRSRDKEEPHSSTTNINGRTTTTLRVLQPNEDVSSELPTHEKSLESSFTISTDNMDDYMSSHGLAPIEWTESDFKSAKEEMPNASAGISVTFSNAEGGEGPRHRYSVTHLESREGEKTDMQGNKNRTSKKVEFSKTEVHFAAESGRFHIVETAGKPPPSNNFRRRRRSPTGLDVGVKSVILQPVATDGMRFGDSPYEIRLLTGSDSSVEHSSRTNEDYIVDELPNSDDQPIEMDNSQENNLVGKSTMFGELSTEQERESEDFQKLSEDTDTSVSSSTVLFGFDEQSPRSILRSSAPPWKSSAQSDHVDDDDSKPKFGGVRLRPVVSPMHHSRVNVTKVEPTDPMVSSTNEDKTYFSSLSPGHMELQKLLRSLRHVSVTYNDSQLSEPSTTAPNVANGGGMEVRICSVGNPSGVSNTIIIGNEATANESTPMSVAQRVREVEERRRKELSERQSNVLKPSPSRGGGQFSTRVTLGSPVISLETKAPKETLQTERTQPLSPKPTAKLSVPDNKITRIHNMQGVAADSLLQSQVATSSDIKTSRLNENPGKTERAQDMPKVTRIALGFREKATDGMRNADESKMEAEDGSEDSTAFTIDVPKAELPKKLTSKVIEQNYDMRKKSVEESVQSGRGRHSVSSPPRDAGSCWRGNNEAKSKRDEDVIKSDSNPKSVRSQRRNKEISEKSSFATSNSSTVEIERFPQNATNSKSFKGETPSNELAGKFSVKMKVIKKSAEEEKSSGTREHKLQETTKTTSHYDCIRRRNSPNTLTTSSKSTESEPGSNSQRSRKESLSRTDFKSVISQASKSPMTDRRNRSGVGLNAIGNPEVSSPSSGRVVRKKLRKRSSGGKVSSTSERKRKENIADDESSFLEELTKAADEILNAVNGYSDEGSSDEEPLKNNPRVAPWRSSPSLRPKVSKNQREARVTPSEGVVSREESRRTSRVTGAKPPVVASNSHGGTYTISAEKGQRSKQQPSSRKSMTRIDPTTRVPEVKLIEKRPPLPPPGQRKTAGLKEKSESIGTRGAHGRPKITASLIYNKDGEPERLKETKRPINIARALEAVMPDSGSKTRKMEVKTEAATKISSSSKRDGNTSNPSSAPSSPATTSSFERKKVASSRDGDKFSRRRLQQNVASPA